MKLKISRSAMYGSWGDNWSASHDVILNRMTIILTNVIVAAFIIIKSVSTILKLF